MTSRHGDELWPLIVSQLALATALLCGNNGDAEQAVHWAAAHLLSSIIIAVGTWIGMLGLARKRHLILISGLLLASGGVLLAMYANV